MAVSPEILKSVTELLSPSCSLGINIRLQNVISTLESVGLIYSSKLAPAAFLCHPQNRGSSMVNAYNAHRKGHDILQAGFQFEIQFEMKTFWISIWNSNWNENILDFNLKFKVGFQFKIHIEIKTCGFQIEIQIELKTILVSIPNSNLYYLLCLI